jgi:hypothetical protein
MIIHDLTINVCGHTNKSSHFGTLLTISALATDRQRGSTTRTKESQYRLHSNYLWGYQQNQDVVGGPPSKYYPDPMWLNVSVKNGNLVYPTWQLHW